MGADLIGYNVKGPFRLDRRMRETAERYAENVIGQANYALSLYPNTDWDEALKNLPELNRLVKANVADTEDRDYFISDIASLDPEEAVNDLFAVWEGGARDVSCRRDPDNPDQCIFFAGDMSWGDEPEGYGYTSIKHAFQLGLVWLFGIH